ncbi:family 16 glycosylhydrolase [Winogradskyella sp. A2]|uniref:glycoside hydrolase family 16 protein n=1 Tax=Winogradskyella sp. A2 TaxID=3366944 RepID=UPI00398C25D1
MNKVPRTIVVILTISMSILSCRDNKSKENNQIRKQIEGNDPWNLVWSDEFNTETINLDNWNFQVLKAGQFNDEWQRYTNSSANAYIEDECLVIKAIHESDIHGMNQYSSARLHTANKQTWEYGKIEARIKLPKGKGIWPAFWMLGANIDENGGDTPWPQCGEIDILELYGTKDDSVIEANLHYADQSDSHAMMGAVSYKLKEGIFADNFHVFGLEWDENKISWFVDGQEFASTSISDNERSEFHKEFFILLNLAVGGTYAGRPDSSSPFPQYMFIDWLRVYQKTNAQ